MGFEKLLVHKMGLNVAETSAFVGILVQFVLAERSKKAMDYFEMELHSDRDPSSMAVVRRSLV
jgi:hypothetical protein